MQAEGELWQSSGCCIGSNAQVDEVSDNARPVSVNLNRMFNRLSFDGVEEVALGAGQKYSQASL